MFNGNKANKRIDPVSRAPAGFILNQFKWQKNQSEYQKNISFYVFMQENESTLNLVCYAFPGNKFSPKTSSRVVWSLTRILDFFNLVYFSLNSRYLASLSTGIEAPKWNIGNSICDKYGKKNGSSTIFFNIN